MRQCRCKQGDQGPIGPTGPSYSISSFSFETGALSNNKTFVIFASAATSGTLTFWGSITFRAASVALLTITPKVNAVATTFVSTQLNAALTTNYLAVPVAGQVAIVAGQSFSMTITSAVGDADVAESCILYSIQ